MNRLIASAAELRFWVSALTRYHSPRKPSLTPPEIGMTPDSFSFAHASMNASHVVGGVFGSRPAFSNSVLVVLDAEADRVEAGAVRLALVVRQLRAAAVGDRLRAEEGVERRQVAEPDVLHVVDAVEQELHVRHVAGRGGLRELRDHLVGVHQQRVDLAAALGGEARHHVVHPLLDADGLLLAPPPHLDVARRGGRGRAGRRGSGRRRRRRRGRARGGAVRAAARGDQRRQPGERHQPAAPAQHLPARQCAPQFVVHVPSSRSGAFVT